MAVPAPVPVPYRSILEVLTRRNERLLNYRCLTVEDPAADKVVRRVN